MRRPSLTKRRSVALSILPALTTVLALPLFASAPASAQSPQRNMPSRRSYLAIKDLRVGTDLLNEKENRPRSFVVRFTVNQDAEVESATITKLDQNVVVAQLLRSPLTHSANQEVSINWDQRDTHGKFVPVGVYTLAVVVHNAKGERVTVKRPLTVLR